MIYRFDAILLLPFKLVRLICALFCIVACKTTSMYSGEQLDMRETLQSYLYSGITIDDVSVSNDKINLSFSDGHSVGFDTQEVPVMTIDATGFWRINGKETDIPLDSLDYNSISAGNNLNHLYGIVEGYTNWTFVFGEWQSMSLGKTLFATDWNMKVRAINHRGYNVGAPENTLPAFRLSKLHGFNYVETDIRFTLDGVPVLIHDATVDRTSDGKGTVSSMTWEKIRCLDFGGLIFPQYAGTKIPSLFEFLSLCHEIELRPYLELKEGSKEQIEYLVKLVNDCSMEEQVTYISFNSKLLQFVLDFDCTAEVGLLTNSPLQLSSVQAALSLYTGSNYVFMNSSDYSEAAVDLCRRASLPLQIWTINSSSTILALSTYISGVASDNLHAGRILFEK